MSDQHAAPTLTLPLDLAEVFARWAERLGRDPAELLVEVVEEFVEEQLDVAEAERRLATPGRTFTLEEVEAEFLRGAAE
jgi:predicted DNA-binding protein